MTERNAGAQVQERQALKRPPLYKVLLHNDDYTPMDFVVFVLMHFFKKSEPDARRVMLAVHHEGRGVAGVYTREVAETKAAGVTNVARGEGHPLRVTLEREE